MPTTYAIPDGRTAMAATTWTGDGLNPRSITNTVNGVSFQPDLVWAKLRSGAASHNLYDSVRGVGNVIYSDLTATEANNNPYGYLTAFNSNGFSSTTGSTSNAYFNANGSTYVGWQWKANGTAVTNTAGTTTTQVSANTTAGFSIVTYTGTGSNMTIGHGLGQAPKLWFWKNRSASSNWSLNYYFLYNSMRFMLLNTPDSQGDNSASYWGNPPTSTVNYVGASDPSTNINGQQFVMYAFAEIAGYSSINSYTGNGSSDGPFVYTGFRPRFILIKSATRYENWHIHDTGRNPSNLASANLYPDLSQAESTTDNQMDILSNGFKLRSTNSGTNFSGATYIYMAFAENPFKNALAR
jgi:hypothetical protein